MGKKVTMDDIARTAGLSKYAVSRAISGKSGVSEKTRAQILQLCDQLGYSRSKEKVEKAIVMFAPKSETDTAAFWMSVIQGIETEAARQGYRLIVKTICDAADEAGLSSVVEGAAGAIFVSHKTGHLAQQVYQICPTLLLTYPPTPLLCVDSMTISDREAMEALTDRLVAWGHKHIAYYGPTNRLFGKELISGILRSAEKAELVSPEIWDDPENGNTYQNTFDWLNERYGRGDFPTAILCASDMLAQAVIFSLNKMSIKVPQQVSVTSFNSDTGMISAIPMTSMGLDKFKYGSEAFQVLHHRIMNPNRPARRIHYLQQFVPGTTAGNVCPAKK